MVNHETTEMESNVAEIEFSAHALFKIGLLKSHGVELSEEMIEDAVRMPDSIEQGCKGRLIAQKRMDDDHVIRIVYEESEEKILVITAYPGKRSRYEKN